MHSDFVGTQRYVIERRLGEGGMGVVYQAYDRERRTAVALKTLSRVDATSIYRLKQEFRSLADVVHPNLVALYDLVSTGAEWFFTMELVRGVGFLDWVRAGEPRREGPRESTGLLTLPSADLLGRSPTIAEAGSRVGDVRPPGSIDAGRVREALRQLVEGVNAIHAAGKLHRDIKPNNVLVAESGGLKVLDFGLVADHEPALDERSVDDNLVVGTPAYMAPEQAAGERASTASDWYAVGAMLYVTLTGRLPFDGKVRDVLALKQHVDPVPPSKLCPGVPRDLDSLCRALLARDPALRPGFGDISARLRLGAASVAVGRTKPHEAAKERYQRPSAFFGRTRELNELVQALRDSRAGSPICCFVFGPAGIGKATLLDRFVDQLGTSTDTILLSGRCYPRESVPYKAFDAVIDALSRHLRRLGTPTTDGLLPRNTSALVRLFPVLDRVEAVRRAQRCARFGFDEADSRPRAFAAIKELLARMADRQPLVVRVDDLQWGDRDSADLLLSLLSPPDAPALLFVGAFRTDLGDLGPMLDRLLESGAGLTGGRRELALRRLDPESSVSLALDLIGRYDDAAWTAAKTIAREGEGNPLLVEELSRHFAERDFEAETVDVQAAARSSIEQLLAERVTGLSEQQRHLLEMLAVAGEPLPQEVLARATGAGDVRFDVDTMTKRRLVRATRHRDASAVELVHDQLQHVVLSRLPAPVVQRMHSLLAAELVASGSAEPEALALHFHAAGEQQLAAEYALRAADKATLAMAFDRAAHFLALALELTPEDGERWRLLTRLADALLGAGQFEEAVDRLAAAARGAPTVEAIRLTKRIAEITLRHRSGDLSQSLGRQGTVGLFDEMPREDVQELLSRFRVVQAQVGELMISHGAPAEAFYVVVSGEVELRTPERSGTVRLGEGAVLAEIPFFRRASFVADVIAASDEVRLLALDQRSLDSLVDSRPRLALKLVMNVARILCEKATGVRRRALEAGPVA